MCPEECIETTPCQSAGHGALGEEYSKGYQSNFGLQFFTFEQINNTYK